MKQREPRQKIMIKARMLAGTAWHDACLLNISSRGLHAQAAAPPVAGTYVEIRRGAFLVIARVVWTKGHRFGLRTQDPIAIDAFVSDSAQAERAAQAAPHPVVERRRRPRTLASAHDRSRWRSRAFEFACVVLAGVSGCTLAFGAVESLFARSIHAVEGALAPDASAASAR